MSARWRWYPACFCRALVNCSGASPDKRLQTAIFHRLLKLPGQFVESPPPIVLTSAKHRAGDALSMFAPGATALLRHYVRPYSQAVTKLFTSAMSAGAKSASGSAIGRLGRA